MARYGSEILRGVGGDILTPREDGSAFDRMIARLYEFVDEREPFAQRYDTGSPFELRSFYRHLEEVVEDAGEGTYADLLRLTWPGKDWNATGGAFDSIDIHGLKPMVSVTIDARNGLARVIDHERGRRERINDLALGARTYNRAVYTDDNYSLPDSRHLAGGYVIAPLVHDVNVADKSGRVDGDSVRAGFKPYSVELLAIAESLARETERSK